MAMRLTNTSDWIQKAAPMTAPPFTVACWVANGSSTTKGVWTIYDDAAAGNWFELRTDGTRYRFGAASAATGGAAGVVFANGGNFTDGDNVWHFIICRAISATSRRIDMLGPDGTITHGQDTTSITPSGLDTIYVGNAATTAFHQGGIAEFWYTFTDIQADGGALDDNFLRQLAYGGPFSVPHVAASVAEYRSLRKRHYDGDEAGDVYYSPFLSVGWQISGAPTIGVHPPLPYWYKNPIDRFRVAIV